MKLTTEQQDILRVLKDGSLQTDHKGRPCFTVPTSVRNSGIKLIKESSLKGLRDMGLIDNENRLITK